MDKKTIMHDSGLSKLSEECGELVQAAQKHAVFLRYGGGWEIDTRQRLIEEIADVMAISSFVIAKLKINEQAILDRSTVKLQFYLESDKACD